MFAIRLLAEFVGTFFFVSVILSTGDSIAVAAGLLATLFFIGKVSGGHVNPAVSATMYAKGAISLRTFLGYVVVQFLGGLAALVWYNSTIGTRRAILTGEK
jgi:glycerol uptake facilitator-like aquaporin